MGNAPRVVPKPFAMQGPTPGGLPLGQVNETNAYDTALSALVNNPEYNKMNATAKRTSLFALMQDQTIRPNAEQAKRTANLIHRIGELGEQRRSEMTPFGIGAATSGTGETARATGLVKVNEEDLIPPTDPVGFAGFMAGNLAADLPLFAAGGAVGGTAAKVASKVAAPVVKRLAPAVVRATEGTAGKVSSGVLKGIGTKMAHSAGAFGAVEAAHGGAGAQLKLDYLNELNSTLGLPDFRSFHNQADFQALSQQDKERIASFHATQIMERLGVDPNDSILTPHGEMSVGEIRNLLLSDSPALEGAIEGAKQGAMMGAAFGTIVSPFERAAMIAKEGRRQARNAQAAAAQVASRQAGQDALKFGEQKAFSPQEMELADELMTPRQPVNIATVPQGRAPNVNLLPGAPRYASSIAQNAEAEAERQAAAMILRRDAANAAKNAATNLGVAAVEGGAFVDLDQARAAATGEQLTPEQIAAGALLPLAMRGAGAAARAPRVVRNLKAPILSQRPSIAPEDVQQQVGRQRTMDEAARRLNALPVEEAERRAAEPVEAIRQPEPPTPAATEPEAQHQQRITKMKEEMQKAFDDGDAVRMAEFANRINEMENPENFSGPPIKDLADRYVRSKSNDDILKASERTNTQIASLLEERAKITSALPNLEGPQLDMAKARIARIDGLVSAGKRFLAAMGEKVRSASHLGSPEEFFIEGLRDRDEGLVDRGEADVKSADDFFKRLATSGDPDAKRNWSTFEEVMDAYRDYLKRGKSEPPTAKLTPVDELTPGYKRELGFDDDPNERLAKSLPTANYDLPTERKTDKQIRKEAADYLENLTEPGKRKGKPRPPDMTDEAIKAYKDSGAKPKEEPQSTEATPPEEPFFKSARQKAKEAIAAKKAMPSIKKLAAESDKKKSIAIAKLTKAYEMAYADNDIPFEKGLELAKKVGERFRHFISEDEEKAIKYKASEVVDEQLSEATKEKANARIASREAKKGGSIGKQAQEGKSQEASAPTPAKKPVPAQKPPKSTAAKDDILAGRAALKKVKASLREDEFKEGMRIAQSEGLEGVKKFLKEKGFNDKGVELATGASAPKKTYSADNLEVALTNLFREKYGTGISTESRINNEIQQYAALGLKEAVELRKQRIMEGFVGGWDGVSTSSKSAKFNKQGKTLSEDDFNNMNMSKWIQKIDSDTIDNINKQGDAHKANLKSIYDKLMSKGEKENKGDDNYTDDDIDDVDLPGSTKAIEKGRSAITGEKPKKKGKLSKPVNDLIFGDEGSIYPELATLLAIPGASGLAVALPIAAIGAGLATLGAKGTALAAGAILARPLIQRIGLKAVTRIAENVFPGERSPANISKVVEALEMADKYNRKSPLTSLFNSLADINEEYGPHPSKHIANLFNRVLGKSYWESVTNDGGKSNTVSGLYWYDDKGNRIEPEIGEVRSDVVPGSVLRKYSERKFSDKSGGELWRDIVDNVFTNIINGKPVNQFSDIEKDVLNLFFLKRVKQISGVTWKGMEFVSGKVKGGNSIAPNFGDIVSSLDEMLSGAVDIYHGDIEKGKAKLAFAPRFMYADNFGRKVNGGMSVTQLHEAIRNDMNAMQERGIRVLNRFRAIKEDQRELLAKYMRGEITDKELASMDPSVRDNAEEMRGFITHLGHQLVDMGVLDQRSFERFSDHYLREIYVKKESTNQRINHINGFISSQFKRRGIERFIDADNVSKYTTEWKIDREENGRTILKSPDGEELSVTPRMAKIYTQKWWAEDRTKQGKLKLKVSDQEAERYMQPWKKYGYDDVEQILSPNHPARSRKQDTILYNQDIDPSLDEAFIAVKESDAYKYTTDWVRDGNTLRSGDKVTIRRELTKEEHEAAGRVPDVEMAIKKTISDSIKNIMTAKFFSEVADSYSFAENPDPSRPGYVQIPKETIPGTSLKRYGKLAGRWVDAGTALDLAHLRMIREAPSIPFDAAGRLILGNFKKNKTVRSWVTMLNNYIGNPYMIAAAGGSWTGYFSRFGKIKEAAQYENMVNNGEDIDMSKPENIRRHIAYQELEEARRYGAIDGNHSLEDMSNEIMATPEMVDPFADDMSNIERSLISGRESMEANILKYLTEVMGKGATETVKKEWTDPVSGKVFRVGDEVSQEDAMINMYHNADTVTRLELFHLGRSQGMSGEEAARFARENGVDYAYNAPLVNLMRKSVAPFAVWSIRMGEVNGRMLRDRPLVALRMAFSMAILNFAASTISNWMAGGDEEKEREALPDRMRNDSFAGFELPDILKDRTMAGLAPSSIRLWSGLYADTTKFIPGFGLADINERTGAPRILGNSLNPAAAVFNTAMGQDPYTGKELAKDERLKALGKQWLPNDPFYLDSALVKRLSDWVAGTESRTGDKVGFSEVLGLGSYVPPSATERTILARHQRESRDLEIQRRKALENEEMGSKGYTKVATEWQNRMAELQRRHAKELGGSSK